MKRIATIIIRNKKGYFFVHQREKGKKTFPNLFGLGAGGHIEDNETPQEAAVRELLEETGLDDNPKFLFNFTYEKDPETYPVEVFEIITDQEPGFSETEWQWSGWLSREKVDKLLEENKLCPDTAVFYQKYCSDFL